MTTTQILGVVATGSVIEAWVVDLVEDPVA
jgi:hypothetical protein